MKTIRNIAEELGVSKTAVRNKLTPEIREKFVQTVSGMLCVLPEGERLIKQAFERRQAQTESAQVTANQCAEVCALVSVLREQIRVKDEQIAAITAAFNTSQYLHAGTLQKQLTDGKEPGFFARLFRRRS
jgi:predicted transcriptional regulator